MMRTSAWLTIFVILCVARAGEAQENGPPPPASSQMISRDESGRATVRAVRVTTPLQVDGRLEEEVYASVPAISDFIQTEPQAGAPATEKTDVWVMFDDKNVYVSYRCWESQPERMIANEMRRDNNNILQNDEVEFILDTFYDRRNAFRFQVNAIGGRRDTHITDERLNNPDWNPVWAVKVGRFEGGWTVEAAVPFKSIRYRPGRAQVWGFNAQRTNRWKNELSFLTRLPNTQGSKAIQQVSLAATLVGLEAPSGSRSLEVKPYALTSFRNGFGGGQKIPNDLNGDAGLDVKYGLTQNLTADFTYRTDFAQAEADEQQVNLTRFSLLFPEKREFFLENTGTFAFGGVDLRATGSQVAPILFYSRRIGLNQNREVPVVGGARLTGRIGRYSVGVLNIESGEDEASSSLATNFSVARVKRDVLRKSSIGAIATGRSVGQGGAGTNEAYGVDGSFAFFESLVFNTFWARTRTSGLSGDDSSYRTQVSYTGDRYGVELDRLAIGDNFNPEIGYVQRGDMRRDFAQFRFSPRPKSFRSIRKFSWTGSLEYIENGAGRLETRNQEGQFGLEFQNGDRSDVSFSDVHEYLAKPFKIATGVVIPVGAYDFRSVRGSFTFGQQRALSGSASLETGTFYSGHKTALSISGSRVKFTPQFAIEPSLSVNWVDLAEGSFRSDQIGSRVVYTVTPLMFASALIQYNSGSHVTSANIRLRWEYQPGSELIVVYNHDRNVFPTRALGSENRALIIKVNRLFRL